MVMVFVCMAIVALFGLPFAPALVEIFRKRDAEPLYIAMHLTRDPRYFARSFRQILHGAVAGWPAEPRTGEALLSKPEVIQTHAALAVAPAAAMEHPLLVRGDLTSGDKAGFLKEVYVAGRAAIGPRNVLHALACDGDAAIGAETVVARWLDAEGDLSIGADCRLGISATCGGRLHLSGACAFRRLYGMPIATGDLPERPLRASGPAQPKAATTLPPMRIRERFLAGQSILARDAVFQKNVRIGRRSVVNGSLRGYGDIELEESVTVHGNLFADGDITIGAGAVISGHIFSQGTVTIAPNSVISRPGVVKSIIGKKAVRLAPGVAVYGYVATEGTGTGGIAP